MTEPGEPMVDSSDVFDLLFVCTGNICRSPMAELMAANELRRRLGERASSVRVHSAGTHGLVGNAIERFAGRELMTYGVRAATFRARRLAQEMISDADLILTATRMHRAAVVTQVPDAAQVTFTIIEFSRLVGEVDYNALPVGDVARRGRALVAAAVARRGMTYVPPGEDDIADPYGAPEVVYRECAMIIAEALRAPMDALCWSGDDAPEGVAT